MNEKPSINRVLADCLRQRNPAWKTGNTVVWSTLKRAHKGVYHKLSAKHLQRYVESFAAKRNIRDADTIDQMAATVAGMFGQSITYAELTANPAGLGVEPF